MQPRVEPQAIECVPDIQIKEVMVAIPAEHTMIHENPSVASVIDNAALLDWAMACAINTRLYEDQMNALRELD